MQYVSTRDKSVRVSSAQAIKKGLSADGGLFLPEEPVTLTKQELNDMVSMSYQERALVVLSKYLTDFTKEELLHCINSAYNEKSFSDPAIAPVKKVGDNLYFLELWHGPTCAFKDMALQILPHLLTLSMKKTGEKATAVILVATSGDTGKAALDGFSDVPGTKIIVFYPNDGVSTIQKLQMVTQKGDNVTVAAVQGNFDNAQTGVKEIFCDKDFEKLMEEGNYILSSANSINWGRLVPQIVYYVSAYCDMVKTGEIKMGDEINVCVPTGNFGNILASVFAKGLGVPIKKFICASNANNVLTEFLQTGVYNANRPFYTTISPSMDILVSSNLERLLFELSGKDDKQVKNWMDALKKEGKYEISAEMKAKITSLFYGGCCDDQQTKATIRRIKEKEGYTCDPHTAVAAEVYLDYVEKTGDTAKTIIASTASPFKFNESVLDAVCGMDSFAGKDEFALLTECAKMSGLPVPESLAALQTLPVRFSEVCEPAKMKTVVQNFLKL